MPTTSQLSRKMIYGLLFGLLYPLLLIVWAIAAASNVDLPAIGPSTVGVVVALCGFTLIVSAVIALGIYGHGAPMSPYPPTHYVTRSVYRYIPHPIYTGFSLLCVGVAMVLGSASGLWLVSPVAVLGCVAWVQGFEKQGTAKRFGPDLPQPLIHLPSNDQTPPDAWDKVSVYVLVMLPWLILYEAVRFLGIPKDAVNANLGFESELPVLEWTELIYGTTYLFVILAPVLAPTKRVLRQFAVPGLISTAIVTLLFFTIPLIAPPRPFEPQGLLGKLLLFERAHDTPAAAFPSFHVIWALLSARVYAARMPSLKFIWWGWALVISASCITAGMHALVDVLAGFVVFTFVIRIERIWEAIRKLSERIANSWREWHLGPIRIINHGVYAGTGTFIGLCIVGMVTGSQYTGSVLLIAFSSLVTAALWAQYIEGSPRLLRPYGFYGGVLGVILGTLIATALGTSFWLMLAAFSVAAPWIQSIGRLRCLVQGCCHGREATAEIGIRYSHPQSRVCKLAGQAGVPIHPTPVYSILWNVVIAMIVTRLWFLPTPLSLVAGTYFILSGLGRFVEEAYRGEPQTPIISGLRLYQWAAIVSVVLGAVFTTLPTEAIHPDFKFGWGSATAALGFGLFTWFALGVDFPKSNRRFARLV